MKSFKRLNLALAGLFAAANVHAFEPTSNILFVRPLGMGGAFTAVADDQNIFNFNPAGMVQRTGGQFTLLEVAIGGSKDLKDAYDFIDKNQEDLTHFQDLSQDRQQELVDQIANDISKLNPRIYAAADVASYTSGPRFLGMPLHAGFGAFGVVDATFRLDTGVLVPNISYQVNNDLVFPLSIAHRWNAPFIPGKIGFGVTGKLIRRSQIRQDRLSVLQLDDLKAPPFATGTGFGGDIGMLYQPTDRINFGMMVKDFMGTKLKYDEVLPKDGYPYQPERTGIIRPTMNVGLALVPKKLLWLVPTSERWTFSADVWDVLNKDDHVFFEEGAKKPFGENLYTHLHLGAEYRWWFLRFRGGASEGYPSFGLGLDIPLLKLDYAYYSRELGRLAGDIRETNHVVSFALRFGSGATESRERIKKAKEASRVKEDAVPEGAVEAPQTAPAPAAGEPVPQ